MTRQVDAELVQVLDTLSEMSNTNLMIFSDHGMASRVGGPTDATSGLIKLLDYVNSSDWMHVAGSGPNVQIWPKSDREDSVSFMTRIKRRSGKHTCIYDCEVDLA